MSYAGIAVDDGDLLYFCHQCKRTTTIIPSPTGDLLCPTCNSDFVEEFEDPEPNTHEIDPFHSSDPFSALLNSFLFHPAPVSPSSSSSSAASVPVDLLNPRVYSPGPGMNPFRDDVVDGEMGFDPFQWLASRLASRRENGVNFQFIIEDQTSGAGAGIQLPANIGDYFIGPGFEQLIQQLAENDPNRYGPPPASESAVAALPDVKVDEKLLKSELAQCAVCKDDFEMGMEVKQMPCKHVYHKECIIPWLELHNSCPVCRYELPTDDPDYEGRADRGSSGNPNLMGSGGASAGNLQGQRVERQFTISLPWPLSGFGSGGASGNGGSESGGQQHRGPN